jgi:hypothetical protein
MLGYDGNELLSPGMEVLSKGVKAVQVCSLLALLVVQKYDY